MWDLGFITEAKQGTSVSTPRRAAGQKPPLSHLGGDGGRAAEDASLKGKQQVHHSSTYPVARHPADIHSLVLRQLVGIPVSSFFLYKNRLRSLPKQYSWACWWAHRIMESFSLEKTSQIIMSHG